MYTEILLSGVRVVFTDDKELFMEEKNAGTCIISTLDSGLSGADAYVENEDQLDELSADFIERIWDRHNRKPHVIARIPSPGGEVLIREMSSLDYEDYLAICAQGEEGIFGSEGPEDFLIQLMEYRNVGESEKKIIREEFGNKVLQHYKIFDHGLWIVEKGGKPAGVAGLMPEKDGIFIGYIIDRGFRNRGLATLACREIVTYAKLELGIEEIFARTKVDNLPSIKILRNTGIKAEVLYNS